MIAFLGMYDLPALHAANDAFWNAIRAQIGTGPDTLTRTDDPWPVWESPDLFFAQTCGYPFRARLHRRVRLVGTPDYGLADCPPGHYRSVLVARADDTRTLDEMAGARLAYNEALSQSGWAAPIHHLGARGIRPGALLQTGAHANSAAAVGAGDADLAGIDALTWELLGEHRAELTAALRVIGRTAPTPALPYITGPDRDAAEIHAAVARAITALAPAHRDALHLHGLVRIPTERYLAVPTPEPPETFCTQDA